MDGTEVCIPKTAYKRTLTMFRQCVDAVPCRNQHLAFSYIGNRINGVVFEPSGVVCSDMTAHSPILNDVEAIIPCSNVCFVSPILKNGIDAGYVFPEHSVSKLTYMELR